MVRVKLLGQLGRKFGREFFFAIHSPAEAIRALSANFRDFAAYLLESDRQGVGYRVVVAGEDRAEAELEYPLGQQTLVIVPVVYGSGAAWRILAGAVLVGVGLATGFSYASVLGTSLILGGIAELLAPTPKDNKQNNYLFSGPVNTTNEGNPVPICYGKLIVGSHVISAAISLTQNIE